jgi:hypothetical protein
MRHEIYVGLAETREYHANSAEEAIVVYLREIGDLFSPDDDTALAGKVTSYSDSSESCPLEYVSFVVFPPGHDQRMEWRIESRYAAPPPMSEQEIKLFFGGGLRERVESIIIRPGSEK